MATKNAQPNFLGIAQKHLGTNQKHLGNHQWPFLIGQLKFFRQLATKELDGPKNFDHQLWGSKVGD